MPKVAPMSFRPTDALKAALEAEAKAVNRSVSNLVETLLADAMKAKGRLK
jgi:hypothetical protein